MLSTKSVLVVLVLALLSLGSAHDEDTESVQLTSDNFQSEIAESNYFVMFFAPWCGHCKKLAPTWSKLAKNAKENNLAKIGRVDCTIDGDLCSEQDVTGYPTLKFFNGNQEAVKYRGARELEAFESFIREQLGLEDENNSEESVAEPPKPVSPLVELTEDTFAKHISSGKHFVKFFAPWCGHCTKLAPTWEELAKTLEHDKSISISKIDCTQYRPICTDFEVKGYPTLLWIEDGKKIEKYSGPRTHADLKEYVSKMAGGLQLDEAAEKVEGAEKDNTSAVVQISEPEFLHVIEKGVTFVKFYAPWCGHCMRMAPTWEQLAEKFVGTDQVKIAKVDCTLEINKDLCSEQEVNGFPTVFIYKNGEKLSEYNGNRSLEDLHDFVTKHVGAHDEL
ncbi:thioredoxin domain-containing protein 5 homolog [Toxorhynchites rutilus septentrionalis]|uniref:thioredoxin domain-containing protein 5 homolog n=1 Tax=Toxorhynchites rutilus septentrionalis TaxID=329112 RepID=UPI0024789766|nr:thioredoxin domain-containing protein 5 homolog [Toxorhynchites rutilus septentrionalis]